MKKNYPKIITADKRNKDHVKAVLKLGFSSDALLRWIFPGKIHLNKASEEKPNLSLIHI